jgi:hypothetical protein
MRILKQLKQRSNQSQQCVLFEDDKYTCRIFCTKVAGPAHQVIAEYDKRADIENLVSDAKHEGLEMIPWPNSKTTTPFSKSCDAGLQHLALSENDCPKKCM